MKLSTVLSTISLGLSLYISSASGIDPIVIKGSKFFNSVTQKQFFIKGVAYQPTVPGPDGQGRVFKDPLSDITSCKRDIKYFKDLGFNAIRVYQVDYTLDHTPCMEALANAGIYLVLDISTPKYSINREKPVYDYEILDHFQNVADAFSDYNNVIGFFAGNEVVNNSTVTVSAPYVKALIRDMKSYMRTKKRYIPIGYSTNDDATTRVDVADYFDCGNATERVDFYGYNIYSWCGDSSFKTSGYADRVEQFSTYNVPVFLSEFGCNTNGVRNFDQVQAIFGPDMDKVFSGGVVYEYSEEQNHYGLVKISDEGSVTQMPCYANLKKQLANVSPVGVEMSSYAPTNQPSTCPSVGPDWLAGTGVPPTPSEKMCSDMFNSLKCVSVNATSEQITNQFSYVCGLKDISCTDISDSNNSYGQYAGCSAQQRLSYMFNQYYKQQGEKKLACNFGGLGKIVTPSFHGKVSEPTTDSGSNSSSSNSSNSSGSTDSNNKSDSTDHKNGAQSVAVMSVFSLFVTLTVASFSLL